MATLRKPKRFKHRVVPYQFAAALTAALAFTFAAGAATVSAYPDTGAEAASRAPRCEGLAFRVFPGEVPEPGDRSRAAAAHLLTRGAGPIHCRNPDLAPIKRSSVISGRVPSRTGGPHVPVPGLTYTHIFPRLERP